MESKVIVITPQELIQYLEPIIERLDKIQSYFLKGQTESKSVYSEAEAAEYLKCSTKKLQGLRNNREIGFVRENGGRKILYKHEHLIQYLEQHELKKKK